MNLRMVGIAAAAWVAVLASMAPGSAQAQQNQIQRIAAKSGETIELSSVFAQVNCRSILLATPEVEVLEGPPEITLSIREQMVPVAKADCHDKVKGGMILATIGQVSHPIEGKLTFRVKYKTKTVNNQVAHVYLYSLFP
ncbi:MAG: hypothetical protein ACLPX9_09100 [Rhodomicrobium sp.]